MKLLLLLLLPFSAIGQFTAGAILSHDTKGGYLQRVWTGENNWFGSLGVEVLTFKEQKPFIPLTLGAGYSFGVPFIAAGAGAGINTARQYGAMAEIGAGVRISAARLQLVYRGAAMPVGEQDGSGTYGQGWFFRVGFVF
ncbi:MAG TPA: hypothetical protein VFT06_00390 [Flavisolibacter sp.]|nr:hypothetical protein [Flavisolibacter sp.]